MTEPRIEDLPTALAKRALPTVGLWNRIEGRPRTVDFNQALRAEIRDPLWMLTRQWQLGEFLGTDAGSPVTASYTVATAAPTRYRPNGGAVEPLPTNRPLEAVAERRALPFTVGPDPIAFDLRLALGRRWLKLVGRSPVLRLLAIRQQYIRRYPITLPDPDNLADTPRLAHPEVWSHLQAVATRRMDGYLLYRHLKHGGRASDGIPGLLGLHVAELDSLGPRLVSWFDRLIEQPTGISPDHPAGNTAWNPTQLEHRFSIAAATPTGDERALTAPEYHGGTLDWHAFSIDAAANLGGTHPATTRVKRTVFPTPVRFSGMPLPRWWAVEDGSTNFAAVRPDSTDLARLIFLEYALVYSNDWFLLPCDLPAGTLASIQELAVTDVFGEQPGITPAGTGDQNAWQRWSMFTLNTTGAKPTTPNSELFLPASVPKVAEGPALEEVLLIRDENANLVWGIEQTVRLPTGEPRRGSEVAAAILAYRQRLVPPAAPSSPHAPVAYQAMNVVPENWIPFIPVHVDESNRAIQLQRAKILGPTGGPQAQPRTALLREGLDATTPGPYYINEEQVPPAGTRITTNYHRTRWHNGRVIVWLGTKRYTGRGEGSSGLAFDQLVDTPTNPDRPSATPSHAGGTIPDGRP